MRLLTKSRILGVGSTPLGKSGKSATALMQSALEKALANAKVTLHQLDGLVAVPSLSEPRFMEGHYIGTRMGLLPRKNVIIRTIDTGGAGPVTGLLEADRMIRTQGCDLVALVAGDAVSSLPTDEFLRRADQGCADPDGSLPSPIIPHGYDRVAQWHMNAYGLTREQLAMTAVIMSRQAVRHPAALTKRSLTLEEVMSSREIAPVTNLLECARRADGGAAIIVASNRFMQQHGLDQTRAPVIIAGGEASGPLYPPKIIDENMFSCEEATDAAYEAAQLGVSDIDFFGLYDCFPICFIRAIEAVKLAPKGRGGDWVERVYNLSEQSPDKLLDPKLVPVNTHGGLLSFGAPWETPAMYNIIEAVCQLRGEAGTRQVPQARRALVYGNGGIFSASAVAILGKGMYTKQQDSQTM